VNKDAFILRVGPDNYESALAEVGVMEFDITGRPMKSWDLVEPEVVANDGNLTGWIERGVYFAASLPPK